MMERLGFLFAMLATSLGAGCRGPSVTPVPGAQENSAEPSPNARIFPAPLQSGAEFFTRDKNPWSSESDAGAPATWLREDEALPIDYVKSRDKPLVTLHGRFAWPDLPPTASVPEMDKGALQRLSEKLQLTTTVDLAATGRMRFRLTGQGFPMPPATELRARTDRYGHVLVWPDGKSYRIVPPGALRAVLNERRADVLPLVVGVEQTQGTTTHLGIEVGKQEITAQLGKIVISRGLVPGTDAAPLLCRFLVELLGVRPSSTACNDTRTPLRAEYSWKNGGRLIWEVTSIERSTDRSAQPPFVPPVEPWFKGDLLPERGPLLLGRSELTSFRTRDAQSARLRADAGTTEGLAVFNRSESARYVLVDGVAVAWLSAHTSAQVNGLRTGRYVVTWRDLLGTTQEPPATLELPGHAALGDDQDAGVDVPGR